MYPYLVDLTNFYLETRDTSSRVVNESTTYRKYKYVTKVQTSAKVTTRTLKKSNTGKLTYLGLPRFMYIQSYFVKTEYC